MVGVNNVGQRFRHIDRCVFCAQEAWVIAAVTKEELLFDAGVGVGECAALGLEDRAEAFARGDDVKPREEVVVG